MTVKDENDQANYIVEQVLANREIGMTLKQQAVLFRTSSHSGALEVELTRRNIPFVKFGGLKFLDSAHVKDLLATLRFAQNPRDRVAGFRILQMLPGIGPQTAGKILDTIAADPSPCSRLQKFHRRRRRARIGLPSSSWSPACARPNAAGRVRWRSPASGMSRISIASTRMPTPARPTFFSSSRSPAAIRAASGFSPS